MTTRRWEPLNQTDWPRWVQQALTNDQLREAWENHNYLVMRGRTFEYRVTPMLETQGHWGIRSIERRRKSR